MFKRKLLFVSVIMICWALAMSGTPPWAMPQSGSETAEVDPIKRAVFTSGIEDREPVDNLDSLSTDSTRVFFFTEIVGMQGKTVTHRWMLDDENKAEVPFAVGGPRWRVYSSKNLVPEWTGDWRVEIVDEEGNELGRASLVYYPAM